MVLKTEIIFHHLGPSNHVNNETFTTIMLCDFNVMFDSSAWLLTPLLMLSLAAYKGEKKKGSNCFFVFCIP